MRGCILTCWPGGGAVVLLLSSRYVACQRLGRPGQGRPLLWAAVCPLLNENTQESIKKAQSHAACTDCFQLPIDPLFSCHFTFSAHLFGRGGGREHAEEGRTSLSPASTRGLRLRLQAEPGRGGWLLEARRWTAIFKRTALVGLWGEVATRRGKACRTWGWWGQRWQTDGERQKWDGMEGRWNAHIYDLKGETHCMQTYCMSCFTVASCTL